MANETASVWTTLGTIASGATSVDLAPQNMMPYAPLPTALAVVRTPQRQGTAHVVTSPNSEALETAVYTYIQALRTLGHSRVNPTRIAKALDLKSKAVEQAILGLRNRGVSLLNAE